MKKHISRAMAMVLAMLMLTGILAMSVSARDILDPNRKCSLKLTLQTLDKDGDVHKISDASVTVTQVASAGFDDNGNEIYTLTDPFLVSGLDLTDFDNAQDKTNQVLDYMNTQDPASFDSVKTLTVTNDQGLAPFQNLAPGLYLVTVKSDYCLMKPYLLTLPRYNEGTDKYDYIVETVPKVEIAYNARDIQVVKVWKGDKGENRPQSVVVELLHDGQVADEVTLSKENDWKHTFQDKPNVGKWTVQEAKVPDGYNAKVTGPVDTDGIWVFTVTNTKKTPPPPLIQTGQLNWPVPVLLTVGAVLILSGWMIANGKKKQSEEK